MAKEFPKAIFDGWFVKIIYPHNVVIATIDVDEDGEFVDKKGSITKTLAELIDLYIPTKKPIQVCIVEPVVKSATMQKHVAKYNAKFERKEKMSNVINKEEPVNAIQLKPFPVKVEVKIDSLTSYTINQTQKVGLITKSIINLTSGHVKEAMRDYFKKHGYDIDNKSLELHFQADEVVATFYASNVVEIKDSKI